MYHKNDTLSIYVSLRLIQHVNKKSSLCSFLSLLISPASQREKRKWVQTTDDKLNETRRILSVGMHLSHLGWKSQAHDGGIFPFHMLARYLHEQRAIRLIVVDNLCARTYVNGSFIIQSEEDEEAAFYPISSFYEGRHRDDLSSSINTRNKEMSQSKSPPSLSSSTGGPASAASLILSFLCCSNDEHICPREDNDRCVFWAFPRWLKKSCLPWTR